MNTEQFDGHTPGPWREILDQGSEDFNGWDELQEMGFNDEARDLIAAAPDLLAEVKRLRLIVHELLKDADHDTHIWFHSNGWCEDLRQPCTVCDSRSDCDQSLITPQ